MSHKVSVLVPAYNSESYIARCLNSILQQSHSNIEAICIDDGSTDGTPLILDEYAKRFPGKVVVEHRRNAGVAASRNRAIELATGDFLTFVDNDDWLDRDFVLTLLDAAIGSNAEVVCSGYRRPNAEGKVIFEAIPAPTDEWGKYLVEAAWAKLYKTGYVRANGLSFLKTNIDEDLYFTIQAIELAHRAEVVPYCGYNWYFNESSVSNTSQRTSAGLLFEETLDAILAIMKKREIPFTPILQHYFVRLVTWFLLYTRKGDGPVQAQANLAHYRDWLNANISGWRNDPFATPLRPTGDAPTSRIAVWLFARHPRLFASALKLYGKGI